MEEKKRRGVEIPHDIVEEILVKVRVKSLVRFRAVSREWRGTVESESFVEKHKRYQKSLQAKIVTIKKIHIDRRTVRSSLEILSFMATNGIVETCPYRIFRWRFTCSVIAEPCDGLLCIHKSCRRITLVNPATNSLRRLPDPTPTVAEAGGDMPDTLLLGLGRENSTVSPRYKVLCFFERDTMKVSESTRCKVFALDSNAWRYVDPPHCRVSYRQPLIHLDGVLYCFGLNKAAETKLLAFDLHTETFQSFSLTPDIGSSCLGMCLLNHRLCIFSRRFYADDLYYRIWGLDINKRSWETMYSIALPCFPPGFKGVAIPVATINNHLILSNSSRTIWLRYGFKTRTVHHLTGSPNRLRRQFFLSFFETLVSVYQ